MRDQQTGTIWQHATGEALVGPLAGERLEVVRGEQTVWSSWRCAHPGALIAVEPAASATGLGAWFRRRLATSLLNHVTRWARPPGFAARFPGLPPHEEVAGLVVGGEARAYPITVLRLVPLVHDQLGGQRITVVYEPGSDTVRAFHTPTGSSVAILTVVDGSLKEDLPVGRCWDARGRPLRGATAPLPPIPVTRAWWLGWSQFHPATTIYRRPDHAAKW